jgi:hypothetical protein
VKSIVVANPLRRHGLRVTPGIAAVVLVLLAAACSRSGSSAGSDASSHVGGRATSASVLGFSRCMRSHGVPNFPDPVDENDLPKISPEGLGVSSAQFNAAESLCQHCSRPARFRGTPEESATRSNDASLAAFACRRSRTGCRTRN